MQALIWVYFRLCHTWWYSCNAERVKPGKLEWSLYWSLVMLLFASPFFKFLDVHVVHNFWLGSFSAVSSGVAWNVFFSALNFSAEHFLNCDHVDPWKLIQHYLVFCVIPQWVCLLPNTLLNFLRFFMPSSVYLFSCASITFSIRKLTKWLSN